MREIIFDTETTGLDPRSGDRLVEIGCVEMINRVTTGATFHCYLNPDRDMPAAAEAVHGLSIAFLSRYSSLSALVATLVIPVVLWILGVEEAALVTAVMTVITYWRHKQNIERLIAGTESKIGKKG